MTDVPLILHLMRLEIPNESNISANMLQRHQELMSLLRREQDCIIEAYREWV
jgi:hypothetical protein